MPPPPLATLPPKADIFLDANIFVYGLCTVSYECRNLLQRCWVEDVVGITTIDVINEVTHRLMLAEARARGFISQERASLLRKRLARITRLTQYWAQTQAILNMNIIVLETDENRLRSAQNVRAMHGLLTNDSLIVAAMRENGLTLLASADPDFDHISGLMRYEPSDLVRPS